MKKMKASSYQVIQANLNEKTTLRSEFIWIPNTSDQGVADVCNFFICDANEKYIGNIAIRSVAGKKNTCEAVFENWADSVLDKDTTKILNKVVQWLLNHNYISIRISIKNSNVILDAARKIGFKQLSNCDSLEYSEDIGGIVSVIAGTV